MTTLPDLTGTDKQIRWATEIRENLVRRISDMTDRMRTAAEGAGQVDDRFRAVMAAADATLDSVLQHTDANWWIDRRPFSTEAAKMSTEHRPHGTIYDVIPQIQEAMKHAHATFRA